MPPVAQAELSGDLVVVSIPLEVESQSKIFAQTKKVFGASRTYKPIVLARLPAFVSDLRPFSDRCQAGHHRLRQAKIHSASPRFFVSMMLPGFKSR
jgi:hypothetical protein